MVFLLQKKCKYNQTHFISDINECKSAELNTCEQDCVNTVGGFSCSCREGYIPLNATHCKGKYNTGHCKRMFGKAIKIKIILFYNGCKVQKA